MALISAKSKKKSNPFDLKYARNKFDAAKQREAIVGKPARNRGKAQAIRHNTLSKQLQSRRSMNQTEGLERIKVSSKSSYEQDMIKEMNKKKKKSLYDLEDDINLTHGGKPLQDLEADELEETLDSGEDSEFPVDINADLTDPNKSKQDVMREIIAKSKFYKAERQKIKEENAELMADLDEQFDDIVKGKLEIRHRHDNKQIQEIEREDSFDLLLKDISLQPRIPSQVILSPEEQEERAQKKLKEQQTEQQGRMDDANHDEDGTEFSFDKEHHIEGNISKSKTSSHKLNQQLLAEVDELLACKDEQSANANYLPLSKKLMENQTLFGDLGRILRSKMQDYLDKFLNAQSLFFPQFDVVVMLNLIGSLFSTSDYHHVVVTPALLMSSMFLYNGYCKKAKNLLTGLQICQAILEYQNESKRYIPEIFTFVSTVLTSLGFPHNGIFPTRHVAKSIHISDDERQVLLTNSINVLRRAVDIYGEYQSFPDIFGSFVSQLEDSSENESLSFIKRKIESFQRLPLRLQDHKPIPLAQLEPDLDVDKGNMRRRSDIQILKRATKREFRGAKRELRRDNAFIAKYQSDRKAKVAKDYKDKINRIMGSIANEN